MVQIDSYLRFGRSAINAVWWSGPWGTDDGFRCIAAVEVHGPFVYLGSTSVSVPDAGSNPHLRRFAWLHIRDHTLEFPASFAN